MDARKVEQDWRARGFSCDLWVDPPDRVWRDYLHNVDELLMVIEGEIEMTVDGVARTVRMQFLLGRGWPFLVAQARAAMVGPVDVVALPLPRSLHFLYPLLHLPLWLWRRARLLGAKRPPKTRAYG